MKERLTTHNEQRLSIQMWLRNTQGSRKNVTPKKQIKKVLVATPINVIRERGGRRLSFRISIWNRTPSLHI